MKGTQTRFRLQPEIIEAMDAARGNQGRPEFVRDAVLLRLAVCGHRIEPVMEAKCIVCGEPIHQTRSTRRYCSAACRMRGLRNRKAAITHEAAP